MGRIVALLYGVVAYLIFFASFLYAIGFVGNWVVPLSVDAGGAASSFGTALMINVLLLGLFAAQHNVMARPAFKAAWTKIVPEPVERSTYVLFASLLLFLLYWQWRPMTGEIWNVQDAAIAPFLTGLSLAGWGLVLASTILINHFDLFGLRQVYLHYTKQEYVPSGFTTPLFYRLVRHPLLLGFMIAFWATAVMTVGHLVFAAVTTVWMLFSIQLEERDLVGFHGQAYKDYQKRVRMIIPLPKRAPAAGAAPASAPVMASSQPVETAAPAPVSPEPVASITEPVASAPALAPEQAPEPTPDPAPERAPEPTPDPAPERAPEPAAPEPPTDIAREEGGRESPDSGEGRGPGGF